jgi:NitT/TauT family transport system permease protein
MSVAEPSLVGFPPPALPRRRLGLLAGQIAVVAIILASWQLASGTLIPLFWISNPSRIATVLWTWIANGSIWPHLGATLGVLALGYGIGAAAGIALGFVLGMLPRVERVVAPYVAALFCLPKIALLPLFIILFGIGIESRVMLVAVVVVFLTLYSTIDGVRDVDRDLIDALRLMGASRLEILRKVLLPSALSWIYTGLRVSVSYALTTTVVGELLQSNQGLGFLIESSAARFDSTGVFAAVVILVIVSVALVEVLGALERRATRWRPKSLGESR